MRHKKKKNRINRDPSHTKATLNSIASAVIENDKITTTLAKAKITQPIVEKLVSLGKKNTLHARRLASKVIKSEDVVKRLFDEVAPASLERNGGYTRLIKKNNRAGDNAPMAVLELTDRKIDEELKKMKNEETNSLNEKEDTSEEEAQSKKGFAEGLRNLFKKNK